MKHSLKCWLWKALWVLSVLALVVAFYEILTQKPILGLAPDLYLWTSLIFGVLAISIKHDCKDCSGCTARPQI